MNRRRVPVATMNDKSDFVMKADPNISTDCIMQSVEAMFGLANATDDCVFKVSSAGDGQSTFSSVAKAWNCMYVISTRETEAFAFLLSTFFMNPMPK